VSHQAFYTSQRLGQGKALNAFDKRAHGIVPTFQFQRDDCAETPLLTLGYVMPGMRRQPRVINARNVWLLIQPRGKSRCVACVMIQARVQGAQTA
jgi:hypothetical protein